MVVVMPSCTCSVTSPTPPATPPIPTITLLTLPSHHYPSRHIPAPPTSWFPKVLNLFTDKKLMGDLPAQKETGFFNSACTLLGNLLRGLLTRSIDVFVCQITKGGTPSLPLFQVELCLRAGGLVFEPSLEEVEESVVFVLAQIAKTMQNVPHLKVHMCIYACTYKCMHIHMYVCMYICMYVCTYVCIGVLRSTTYARMYVCMYLCTCILQWEL